MRGKFKDYRFRASQSGILMTGTIGLTEKQQIKMRELRMEKKSGMNKRGSKINWTDPKGKELESLEKGDNKDLPKTIQTAARQLHRAETHNRNFFFTNKYVQKGINEENEAITTYGRYCAEVLGVPKFFVKNDIRLNNEHFTGEADLVDSREIDSCTEGIDIKSSWELETFPFPNDVLNKNYVTQNQVYMNLWKVEHWSTVYVLVNAPADLVYREKMRFHVAWGSPEETEDPSYAWKQYLKQAKEVEKRLIFDRVRFDEINPVFDWDTTKKEWNESVNPFNGKVGCDIDLKDRVVVFNYEYSKTLQEDLELRARLTRKYMSSL